YNPRPYDGQLAPAVNPSAAGAGSPAYATTLEGAYGAPVYGGGAPFQPGRPPQHGPQYDPQYPYGPQPGAVPMMPQSQPGPAAQPGTMREPQPTPTAQYPTTY